MALRETTRIPEVQKTIVKLRQLSGDEKIRQEAFYREKRLHDEASALGHAGREGIAEGMEQGLQKGIAQGPEKGKRDTIARMRSLGISEEQIRLIYGDTDI